LSLLIALTGLMLGAARGQAMTGGTVILCAGAAVRVAADPASGSAGVHICPDMALSLLAGVAAMPPDTARPAGALRPIAVAAPSPLPQGRPGHDVRARGPPLPV
jgi:hypothetical protein